MDVNTVAVAGTGMMGPGMATVFALAGKETIMVSRNVDSARAGVKTACDIIARMADSGLVDTSNAQQAVHRLRPSGDSLQSVKEAQIFIESIPENLAIKQNYFYLLDQASGDTILCSNTSGISITEIAAKCSRPERVIGTHFWNPPHLIPLVEVIAGKQTDVSVADQIATLLDEAGKTPVLVRNDPPGQLGNRIQHAMIRECIHIVSEGIASAEDVDRAIKSGFGLRMPAYGVFEHADIVGLDLVKAIQDYVLPSLSKGSRAADLMNKLVADGHLGANSGRGFLEWPDGKAEDVEARRDAFVMDLLRQKKSES